MILLVLWYGSYAVFKIYIHRIALDGINYINIFYTVSYFKQPTCFSYIY